MIGRQLTTIGRTAAGTAALVISLLLPGQSAALAPAAAGAEAKPAYLYRLSDFEGLVPFSGARIFTEPASGETFVIANAEITVFNRTGMEIFRRTYDASFGSVFDAAVDEQGRICLLTYRGSTWSLLRLNYRFDPIDEFSLTGLPAELAGFNPNQLLIRGNRLYLVSSAQLRVVQTTVAGEFVRGWDLLAELRRGGDLESLDDLSIGGLTVDAAGSLYFTLPVQGRAYRLAADGTLTGFGRRGSGPGKFGVISDIAVDDRGNCLVADKLRSVVMIFDAAFNFVTEFGGRGWSGGRMIVPSQLVLDPDGRLYVSQMGRRGVSVFQYHGP